MKTIEVNLMEYYELEKLVNDNFFDGEDSYSFPNCEEVNNDVEKLYMNVKKDEGLFDFEKENIIEFINGYKDKLSAHLILQELCKREKIEEGNYLIRVSW